MPTTTISAPARAVRANRARGAVRARSTVYAYETIALGRTLTGTHFIDLTEHIDAAVAKSGVKNGVVHVLSRHTTTAVTINENEARLMDDARMYFAKLAPATDF